MLLRSIAAAFLLFAASLFAAENWPQFRGPTGDGHSDAKGLPLNFGFFGKGNAARTEPLVEQIVAGAMGLKLHEDWGTTPATIDAALTVADEYDVQVAIHTDTLNESGFVEDTLAAIKDRTIHTYHSEGAGGGHAPDILKVCAQPNVHSIVFGASSRANIRNTRELVARHWSL